MKEDHAGALLFPAKISDGHDVYAKAVGVEHSGKYYISGFGADGPTRGNGRVFTVGGA